MNSTLKALAALACWLTLPAAALNHEVTVNPGPAARYPVACSNLEIDTARLAQLGGLPADYYEGHEVNGATRYISDILAQPDTAFRFRKAIPFKPFLYPTLQFQSPEFVALICHPTSASNTDPDYVLPGDGGRIPHMQRAGAAPKIISNIEQAGINGVYFSPPPPLVPAQLPLIVYSHGLGGSPVGKGYIDVAVQLAAQGYMVAAVFHADNRYSPVRIENIGDLAFALVFFPVIVQMQALRPFALRAMTDNLLANPWYNAAIDGNRIGAFGASLGGEAVAHLVGAKITSSLFKDCSETERDPRIRAAVAYVPYSGQSFLPAFCDDQSGADFVNKPFLAIAGTADVTAPIKLTQQAINRMGSSHYLVSLEGGEHELRPEDASDVITWMVTFMNAYMDVPYDPGAMARFIRMGRVNGGRQDNLVVDVHKPFANVGEEVVAREFHNDILDHYFVAAGQDEIDIIQNGGAGPGWHLTGESFKVMPTASQARGPTAPVCRFYGGLSGGPNSHFFTASAEECALVKSRGGWYYEGIGFYIRPVDGTGVCPDGYLSVNRAYNNGFVRNDSNHRFSTSNSSVRALESQGWTVEGTVMCARP
ncbi:MAG: hypothetical protein ABIQ72_13045 [Usitatibacter sp.]